MKEHLLTLFLAITTGITVFIFITINTQQAMPVFSMDEILFEHHTSQGNIIVRQNAYDEFALSFVGRGLTGTNYAGSSYATIHGDVQLLTLVADNGIPFTTHAVVSTNPELHQIIIMEAGLWVAHRAHTKRTTCERVAVFLVSSVDLTGNNVLIVGLDATGTVIVEIEIP